MEREQPRPAYTISGGRADADRLRRQAQVMQAATGAFLDRAGIRPGWACLDVGCGDGQVTLQMAAAVGPGGRAVGLDVDAEALEIARGRAADAGLAATFVAGDAAALPGGERFDLAFARLLLSHLADPSRTLRQMRDSVHIGGVIAVEDLFTGTLRSEPAADALDRLQAIYSSTVRAHGGDPTIGPRLPALLRNAGLTDVRSQTVENRMDTVEEKLFLVELLDNMRPAILAADAASADELNTVRDATERLARRQDTVFHQARMHQVWGRRR